MKPSDVQLYSSHARELKHTQRHKVLKFLEANCIVWDTERKVFICRHIEGYNTTDHEIGKDGGEWTCDCQFFNQGLRLKERRICSHIAAVLEWCARRNASIRNTKVEQAMLTMFGAGD